MVVARLRLEVARRRWVPDFFFIGKFNTTQARCMPLATAQVAARCERVLSMESCLLLCPQQEGKVCLEGSPSRGPSLSANGGRLSNLALAVK